MSLALRKPHLKANSCLSSSLWRSLGRCQDLVLLPRLGWERGVNFHGDCSQVHEWTPGFTWHQILPVSQTQARSPAAQGISAQGHQGLWKDSGQAGPISSTKVRGDQASISGAPHHWSGLFSVQMRNNMQSRVDSVHVFLQRPLSHSWQAPLLLMWHPSQDILWARVFSLRP